MSGGNTGAQGVGTLPGSSRPGPPPIDESIFKICCLSMNDKVPRSEAALGRCKFNYILSFHPTFAPRDPTPEELHVRATHLEHMKKSKRVATNRDLKKLTQLLEKETFEAWEKFLKSLLGDWEYCLAQTARTGFVCEWVLDGLRRWQSRIAKETGGTIGELTVVLEKNDLRDVINQLEP